MRYCLNVAIEDTKLHNHPLSAPKRRVRYKDTRSIVSPLVFRFALFFVHIISLSRSLRSHRTVAPRIVKTSMNMGAVNITERGEQSTISKQRHSLLLYTPKHVLPNTKRSVFFCLFQRAKSCCPPVLRAASSSPLTLTKLCCLMTWKPILHG